MFVKIIKTESNNWYANDIGKTYEVCDVGIQHGIGTNIRTTHNVVLRQRPVTHYGSALGNRDWAIESKHFEILTSWKIRSVRNVRKL